MATTQLRGKQIGPLPLDAASGEVSGQLPVVNGGTGQSSASAALDALLPTQTGHASHVLKTNATTHAWAELPTISIFGRWFTFWQTGDADPTAGGTITRPSGLRMFIQLTAAASVPTWAASGDIICRDAA